MADDYDGVRPLVTSRNNRDSHGRAMSVNCVHGRRVEFLVLSPIAVHMGGERVPKRCGS